MPLPIYDWLDVSELLPDAVSESDWRSLIRQMLAAIDRTIGGSSATLRPLQIKEKLGGLRFYYRLVGADAVMKNRIADAVRVGCESSRQTCLKCGGPGSVRDLDRWIVPTCDDHADRRCL